MCTSGASYLCESLARVVGYGVAEFRFLTWNVQNLFAAGTKDGPPTQEAFDAKVASLAEVLDAQRPDVAALQELGPPRCSPSCSSGSANNCRTSSSPSTQTAAASGLDSSAACPWRPRCSCIP
jgi:hypothetical protein